MAELTIRPDEIRDALQKFVADYNPSAAATDEIGIVSAAYETPGLRHLEIQLNRYPDIREALETSVPGRG